LGLPLFRLTLFHCSRSAGVKGRDWSTTNGSSKGLVASMSSLGFSSQYGFDFISVLYVPIIPAALHEFVLQENTSAVNSKPPYGSGCRKRRQFMAILASFAINT
jgi:hypothetical protein